jgi:hypothetical protein
MAAVVAGVSLLGLAVASPALADTNVGSTTTLAGVGSDTSQDVMEGLSASLTSGGNPVISNYKATPVGRSITTRTGNANCTFTAPANSGQGRDALSAAMRAASFNGSPNLSGCVDFARSSSGGNPTTSPGVGSMTYIPFATDAVSFATLGTTSVGHKLAKSDLLAIYSKNGTPGTASCIFRPLLPTFGSGTRGFFLTSIGLTDTVIGTAGGPGTCVVDTIGGTNIEENDGSVLTLGTQIIPFSVAQYFAQAAGATGNILGRSAIGAIDFSATPDANLSAAVYPVSIKSTFSFTRPIYNVVPTAQTAGGTLTNSTFVGSGSQICQAGTLIEFFGFGQSSTCGNTSKTNTN